jgi:hypothetical protein
MLHVATIESVCTFVDGDRNSAEASDDDPTSDHHFDVVAGIIADWTGKPKVDRGVSKTPLMALQNVGKIVGRTEQSGFDFFFFEPKPQMDFEMPNSFGGTSGGPLWRIHTKRESDGSHSLVKRRLIGVAFYEQEDRQIICHGPKSIYVRFFERIRGC